VDHEQSDVVVVRAVISHGCRNGRTASLRIARGDGCAQLGDALINGLIAALDQPVGVQAQLRAGREVQGAYLAGTSGWTRRWADRGPASADAAGWPGPAMMDGRCPAEQMRTWSRDGLNIAYSTVAIASGSKSAHSSSSSGNGETAAGMPNDGAGARPSFEPRRGKTRQASTSI
jgi:hypothetical protein